MGTDVNAVLKMPKFKLKDHCSSSGFASNTSFLLISVLEAAVKVERVQIPEYSPVKQKTQNEF